MISALKKIVLSAIENGRKVVFYKYTLKSDKDVVMAAVSRDVYALGSASRKFQEY